jgi:hypothetical protein
MRRWAEFAMMTHGHVIGCSAAVGVLAAEQQTTAAKIVERGELKDTREKKCLFVLYGSNFDSARTMTREAPLLRSLL